MSIVSFYKEVKNEVFKVVWPSNKETVTAATLVFAMVIISGLFFLAVDSLLFKFVKLILG